MYGLVNKAIEDMVHRTHGASTWRAISNAAGVNIEGFISTRSYPDEVTYKLVAASSAVLKIPPDAVLKTFGEFWILNTAVEHYGALLRASGRSVSEFLQRLAEVHGRLHMMHPELNTPSFSCSDITGSSLHLHYRTARPAGLEPFVEGLVLGLGRMFDQEVRILLLEDRNAGADHSIFEVRWSEKGVAHDARADSPGA